VAVESEVRQERVSPDSGKGVVGPVATVPAGNAGATTEPESELLPMPAVDELVEDDGMEEEEEEEEKGEEGATDEEALEDADAAAAVDGTDEEDDTELLLLLPLLLLPPPPVHGATVSATSNAKRNSPLGSSSDVTFFGSVPVALYE